jgi:hypothetical protein
MKIIFDSNRNDSYSKKSKSMNNKFYESQYLAKEVFISDDKPNISKIYKAYPGLKNKPGLKQKFEIFKQGKSEALIVFPGKHRTDADYFKKGKAFKEILQKLEITVVIVNWPSYSYIPELANAQIEDLCMAEGIKTIKILGTSYGGYCALELIADIKKKRIPLRVSGLITIVSPTSFQDIRLPTKIKIQATRIAGELLKWASRLSNFKKLNSNHYPAGKVVRNGAILGKVFSRQEVFTDIPVLSITTTGLDLLLDNNKSAERMQKLFDKVEIMQVNGSSFYKGYRNSLFEKFDIQGAHEISREEGPVVRKKIIDFFSKES